jgi:hypothetical protein
VTRGIRCVSVAGNNRAERDDSGDAQQTMPEPPSPKKRCTASTIGVHRVVRSLLPAFRHKTIIGDERWFRCENREKEGWKMSIESTCVHRLIANPRVDVE